MDIFYFRNKRSSNYHTYYDNVAHFSNTNNNGDAERTFLFGCFVFGRHYEKLSPSGNVDVKYDICLNYMLYYLWYGAC